MRAKKHRQQIDGNVRFCEKRGIMVPINAVWQQRSYVTIWLLFRNEK